MAARVRLGLGMVGMLLMSGVASAAIPEAPAPELRPAAVVADEDEGGAAVATALHMTEVQLLLVQAFRALKAGDGERAYALVGGAEKAARRLDPARLDREQRDKIKGLIRFVGKYDKGAVLAALRQVVADEDAADLATRASVLLVMKHWYALGVAVLGNDKDGAAKELFLTHRALAAVDFDALDADSRERLLGIKRRVDRWLHQSGQEQDV